MYLSSLISTTSIPTLYFFAIALCAAASTANVVDLGYSKFRGTITDGNVTQYLGMPYAASPVADLRWRAPEEPSHTHTIQDATMAGPICWGTNMTYGTAGYSEDCLTVDVFAPSTPDLSGANKNGYPVLLFISGGGYVTIYNAGYNGTGLVQASSNNMIVVTFNYRVGLYGFLSSDRLKGGNGDLNVGLLDQRKAFQWVQRHISKFGGDPSRVTINGVSAGAGSIAHHLAAYGGRNENLFSAVIAESVYAPWSPTVSQTEYQFDRVAEATGCLDEVDQLACLRNLSSSALLAANLVLPYPGASVVLGGLGYWQPVIDGDLVRESLYDAFASGNFFTVPAIVGDTTNEGTLFAPNVYSATDLVNLAQGLSPLLPAENAAKVPLIYPVTETGPNAGKGPWFPAAANALGENIFICPGNTVTAALVNFGGRQTTWNYHWDVQGPITDQLGYGAFHAEEVIAIWGTSNVGSLSAQAAYIVSQALVTELQAYWISFVTAYNPNPLRQSGQPKWNVYGEKQARLHIQSNQTGMETVPGTQNKRCKFWAGLQTELRQ